MSSRTPPPIRASRDLVRFVGLLDDLLRDTISRSHYPEIILSFILLRRLECVLAPTKPRVLAEIERGICPDEHTWFQLTGVAFYNTSAEDLKTACQDPAHLLDHLQRYLEGWSPNIRALLSQLGFEQAIHSLNEGRLLPLVTQRFASLDLRPDVVSHFTMSDLFEELIRRYHTSIGGEHFTPPEVARLMTELVADRLPSAGGALKLCDPCCGTGSLLLSQLENILGRSPGRVIELYGQELNPASHALCRAALYLCRTDGHDAERIALGNTLTDDRHAGIRFDAMLANPPFGRSWASFRTQLMREAERGEQGRFSLGLPGTRDSQMLFLQHLLSHSKSREEGGSTIIIVTDGSPLFVGGAGSGESEVRRAVIEQDWLEGIIALPEGLFYNAGISSYLWILNTHKEKQRRGKVQLIDARALWCPLARNQGEKRRELTASHCAQIVSLFQAFEEGPCSKIYEGTAFGYRTITIERPLRLSFQVTADRAQALASDPVMLELVSGKKRSDKETKRTPSETLVTFLSGLSTDHCKDRTLFADMLEEVAHRMDLRLPKRLRAALLQAFSSRDEEGSICYDEHGKPETDPQLRDTERVPLDENIHDFFRREVASYVHDAWINTQIRDERDGDIGKVGYEINVHRRFYRYQPPRSLDEIDADIRKLEQELMELMGIHK